MRAKHKNYPLIPHTLDQLDFFKETCKSYTETTGSVVINVPIPGKRFLLFDGYQDILRKNKLKCRDRVTIFCSDYGLRLLNDNE